MKHCPACNFSFPDFHRVCDFDGTDLIPDPEPRSLVIPQPSRFRRTLRSPLFWGAALAFAAVSNAFLFSLYDANSQSTPAAKAQPSPASQASIGSLIPSAQARESTALTRRPVLSTRGKSRNSSPPLSHAHLARIPSSSGRQRREVKTARTPPRQEKTAVAAQPSRAVTPTQPAPLATISREVLKPNVANTNPQKTEAAQRKETQQASRPNDPKLVSMLKTTWRVLKKPFKF